jgi:hypothetical protein
LGTHNFAPVSHTRSCGHSVVDVQISCAPFGTFADGKHDATASSTPTPSETRTNVMAAKHGIVAAVIFAFIAVASIAAQDPAPPAVANAVESVVEKPATPLAESVVEKPRATKVLRVAVMDLKLGETILPRTGRIVADNIVSEIRKLQGVTVVSMDELRTMLEEEANRQTLGCDEKSSCLAEITDALGADVIIVGSVADLDGARVFSLRRVEQNKAAVAADVNERLVAAGGEELLAAVGPSVAKLFPDTPLKPGEQRGVAPERARLLNPPPLPVWSTVAVAGAGVVALAGGVGLGVAAANEADGLQAQLDASVTSPTQGKLIVERQQRVDQLALAANVLYIAAGAGALSTGAMALFTDWTNAHAAE